MNEVFYCKLTFLWCDFLFRTLLLNLWSRSVTRPRSSIWGPSAPQSSSCLCKFGIIIVLLFDRCVRYNIIFSHLLIGFRNSLKSLWICFSFDQKMSGGSWCCSWCDWGSSHVHREYLNASGDLARFPTTTKIQMVYSASVCLFLCVIQFNVLCFHETKYIVVILYFNSLHACASLCDI